MKNLLAVMIIFAIVTLIVIYLVREKKRGAVCIACPYSGKCSGSCHSLDDFDSEKVIIQ